MPSLMRWREAFPSVGDVVSTILRPISYQAPIFHTRRTLFSHSSRQTASQMQLGFGGDFMPFETFLSDRCFRVCRQLVAKH